MEAPRTILVYSGLELVGDGLMKMPFLSALRATWPRARITWLAGKGKSVYASVLAPLAGAYLDEVIEDAGIGNDVVELLRRPLPGRSFDLIIDTQRRGLTTLIVKRIRHRVFVSGTGGFLFSDRKPADPRRKPPAMIDQLLQLLSTASGRPAEPGPPTALPDGLLAAAQRLLPPGPVYVGLAPGSSTPVKCWPLDRFVELARIVEARGWQPVFFMGPLEQGELPRVRAAVPEALFPDTVTAAPGEAWSGTLRAVALARQLAVAVANDSGIGHMLAAGGAPMVSLFGPSNPAKTAPGTRDLTVIRAQDFGGDTMAAISLEAVAAAVERRLARGSASPGRDRPL
jgi:ADP-heptose:LPS heptosyltransferase